MKERDWNNVSHPPFLSVHRSRMNMLIYIGICCIRSAAVLSICVSCVYFVGGWGGGVLHSGVECVSE